MPISSLLFHFPLTVENICGVKIRVRTTCTWSSKALTCVSNHRSFNDVRMALKWNRNDLNVVNIVVASEETMKRKLVVVRSVIPWKCYEVFTLQQSNGRSSSPEWTGLVALQHCHARSALGFRPSHSTKTLHLCCCPCCRSQKKGGSLLGAI